MPDTQRLITPSTSADIAAVSANQAQSLLPSSYWLPFVLVLAVVFILFLPIRGFGFSMIDDANNIFANRFICHLGNQDIGHLWRHPYYELYMPVTDTVWALLARIAPLKTPVAVLEGSEPSVVNAAVFHTASLVLHVATTGLIYGILKCVKFKPWACAAGALIFGADPLQVESVAWITGMNNLICGFFSFSAVYIYLLADTGSPAPKQQSNQRPILLTLATFLFAVALLSKPLATILPLIVIAIESVLLRRPASLWVKPIAVWLFLSVVCTLITQAASGSDSTGTYSPVWGRLFIAGDSLAFYVGKVLYPADVTFDYMRNPYNVLHSWWGYVTWTVPVAVCGALWLTRVNGSLVIAPASPLRRSLQAGFLILVAAVLPTIGLVPYYSESISSVSDRFLYLAMLGPAVAVAGVFSLPLPKRKVLAVVPVALLAALAGRSALEVPIWSNMFSLTNDMLDSTPNSPMAHQCYGILLCQRRNWKDSLTEFQKAEKLNPGVSFSVDDSIGLCLYHLKRYDEAIAHYKESIRIHPDDNEGWFQLWLVWSNQNRLAEAESYIRARIAEDPEDDRAKFTLGLVLMQENRPADALPYVELAAKSDPENSDSQYYVGATFQKLGRYAEAAEYYRKALNIDSQNADARSALSSLPR